MVADPAGGPRPRRPGGLGAGQRDLAAETYRLVVLDEFTYPIANGTIDVAEVLAVLADRPGVQHVVVTGRRPTPPWSTRPTWSPT